MSPVEIFSGGIAVLLLLFLLGQVVKMRQEWGGLPSDVATHTAQLARHDEVIGKMQEEAQRMDGDIMRAREFTQQQLAETRHLLRNEMTVVLGQYNEERKDVSDDVEHRLRDLEKRKR